MTFPPLWRLNLVPASFNGVPFKVDAGARAGGRRTATFEFPKFDIPYSEDMGRRARRFSVTGYVLGDLYTFERDALIAELEAEGPGILIHPTLGTFTVYGTFKTSETRERGGICIIEMDFVEAGQQPGANVVDDTQSLVGMLAGTTGTAVGAALDTAISAALQAGATVANITEAVGVLGQMLTTLRGVVSGQIGIPGSSLFLAIGDLLSNGEADIRAGALGTPLLAVFEQATTAGATLAGMTNVLSAMQAEAPSGALGIAVANAGINMALVEIARILSATTFTSSNDVSAAIATNNANFSSAEETVGDSGDVGTYQALVALHGSVTRDLVQRALQLPSLVTYNFPRSLPSIVMAWKLYADSTRADELAAENKVIHPAFMPASGIALSA
ncbi:MAG TPA: DNA circularization N-terminal domain-containing protein [Xanthobacteraceae bacterium]|nr:DNA circularization N-terminal domain-containing protein [Xanthobacteraceae bacterium]